MSVSPVGTATLTTLDRLADENGIDHLHLLKLDIEGYEVAALRGAQHLLTRTDAVQFEFGGTNIDSHTFLRDIASALPGFVVHRLLPDGLWPQGLLETSEIFVYANYVALREGHSLTIPGGGKWVS